MKKNTLKTLTILLVVLFIFTSCEGWNVQTTPITQSEAVIAAVVDNFIQDAYTVGDSVTNISSADIPYIYTYTDGTAATSGTIAAGDTFTLSARGYITLTYGGYEVSVCVTDPDNVAADTYFAGGLGIEKFPYLISSEEEFNLVGDLSLNMLASLNNYYYFKVTSDLDYSDQTESPVIPYLRGELDFDGHTLSGLSSAFIQNYSNETDSKVYNGINGSTVPSTLIGSFGGGKISNLDIIVDDYLTLVSYAQANGGNKANTLYTAEFETTSYITFYNITYEGTITGGIPNNYGNFLLWTGDAYSYSSSTTSYTKESDTIVTFENCVSAVDIQYPTYFAPFLGGYAYNSGEVYFKNCENKGTIIGTQVSAFVGNPSALASSRKAVYYFENCANSGKVMGTTSADFYCSDVSNARTNLIFDKGGNTEGTVTTLGAANLTVTVGSDSVFSITNTAGYSYVELEGIIYGASYFFDGTYYGTHMIKVNTGLMDSNAISACTFKKLSIIDQSAASSNTPVDDLYGNKIVTVSGTEYYYYDGRAVSPSRYVTIENSPKALTWYVYCYDESKTLVATSQLSV